MKHLFDKSFYSKNFCCELFSKYYILVKFHAFCIRFSAFLPKCKFSRVQGSHTSFEENIVKVFAYTVISKTKCCIYTTLTLRAYHFTKYLYVSDKHFRVWLMPCILRTSSPSKPHLTVFKPLIAMIIFSADLLVMQQMFWGKYLVLPVFNILT